MAALRLVLMVFLAFTGEASAPLVPEAFAVEEGEDAHRLPRAQRVRPVRHQSAGPAPAQPVAVATVRPDRRHVVARARRHGTGSEVRKIPSPVPDSSSSPEAH
jgi:hypothetical protein